MITILLFLIYLILIFCGTHFLKCKFNFLNIFNTIWFLVLMFSTVGLYKFPVPNFKTITYLLVGILSFNFMTFFSLSIRSDKKKNMNLTKRKTLNSKKMRIILLVLFLFMLPMTIRCFLLIYSNGFSYVRNLYLSGLLFDKKIQLIWNYIIRPLSVVLLIYNLLEYSKDRKKFLNLILNFLIVAEYVICTASRGIIFELLVLTLIINLNEYKKILKILKQNKKIIILFLLVIMILVIITSERSLNSENGILFNVYCYFCGSIHLFDYLILNPDISLLNSKNLLYGLSTFNGPLEIFKILMNTIFDTNIKSGIEIINEVTQQYYNISNIVVMNNNVTMFYGFLRDFDFLGIIIGPELLAVLYSIAYKYKKKYSDNDCCQAIYCYLTSLIPYTIFELKLTICSYFIVLLMLVLLHKILYKPIHKEVGGAL